MVVRLIDPQHAAEALAPLGVGVCTGEDTKILDANDAFLRMTGYDRADLDAGQFDYLAITPPEWQDADHAAVLFIERHGYCRPYLKQYVRKDGSRIDIILTGALTSSAPRRWICFVVDVTSLARELGTAARSAVGVSAPARNDQDALPLLVTPPTAAPEPIQPPAVPALLPTLAHVLDASPTGALVLDHALQAVHVTPAACRLGQGGRAHWAGDGWRDQLHPEDRALLDGQLTFALGAPITTTHPVTPVRVRSLDGHWRPIEIAIAGLGAGGGPSLVLYLHDPAPLAEVVQRAARDAASRRLVAEAGEQVVLLVDGDRRVLSLDGRAHAALFDACGVSDAPALVQALAEPLGGALAGYAQAFTAGTETGIAFDCHAMPVHGPDGHLLAALLVARRR